jgi:hypothetical protein
VPARAGGAGVGYDGDDGGGISLLPVRGRLRAPAVAAAIVDVGGGCLDRDCEIALRKSPPLRGGREGAATALPRPPSDYGREMT